MKNWCLSEFKYFVLIIVSPIVLLALIGCATTQEPLKKARIPFMQRAQTKRQTHLEVTVAIPSESEAEDLFSAPLSEKGIQPIWIRIKNYENSPHLFLLLLVDQNYYPPYEVVYKFKRSKNQDWYTEIKQKSIHHSSVLLRTSAGFGYAETAQNHKRKKSPSLMDDLHDVQRCAGVGWTD
ncbi:MAG: hypothetical protein OET21_06885 [Desulfobacterales bacterium]|jgi:hypothetical protein|nr:hypothetical protein [Desulfobacterales bacterium]MDH3837752.1 hypothetical protein [Desulfobacteraceae bacterium]